LVCPVLRFCWLDQRMAVLFFAKWSLHSGFCYHLFGFFLYLSISISEGYFAFFDMRILIFLLLFYGIQGTRIDYDKIKADSQDVICNFKNYNEPAPDLFPKISAPHSRGCRGEILR
jgi:hypothetical protein